MASYKLRCIADQKEYEIVVGVFRGKTYKIDGYVYSDTFPNDIYWSEDSLPLFYSRGTNIFDLADIDYWLQNTFEFVNDTRYTLRFVESYNDYWGVWRVIKGESQKIDVNRVRSIIGWIQINGRDTARFIEATYSKTDEGIDNMMSAWFKQQGFSGSILYDSANHVFIYASCVAALEIYGTSSGVAQYDNNYTTYLVKNMLHESVIYRDFYMPSNPPSIAVVSGEQTPFFYTGHTTLQNTDYGKRIVPNYQVNVLVRGIANMYYPYSGNTLNYRPANELLWYLLYDKYEPQDDPIPDKDKPPDGNPDGDSPPWTGGGGEQDGDTDPIPPPDLPGINLTGTGVVELYKMTSGTLRNLFTYLWTNTKFTAIAKLFSDPMQAVISLKMYPFYIGTSRSDNIVIGNVVTDVVADVINGTFLTLDFGTVKLKPFYNDASDYSGTKVSIFLPFIGYRVIDTNDFMNANISLQYNVDLLTGVFVAILTVSKSVNGTELNSVIQQFNGLISYDIPLSSLDATNITRALVNIISNTAQGAIAGGVSGAVGGAVSSGVDALMNTKIRQENVGSISANHAFLGVFTPYLIVTRPIYALPNQFSHYIGYPYEGYQTLGNLKGFTQMREVFIDTVIGTPEETEMIRRGLLEGVIL